MSDVGHAAGPAAEDSGPSQDERIEIERLRAELDELRTQQPPAGRRRIGWRAPVAVLLIFLGCLLAPISVLGVWTANQVSNTDRYVANMEPLVQRGLTIVNKIPSINPTSALFSDTYLVKAQTGYRLVNDLKIVLPILALLPPDAAAALFDTLVRFIKEALRAILVAGLVVAAAAFLTGPSVTAVKMRGAAASGVTWLRRRFEHAGVQAGPVGTWTYAHRRALRISAVALAALIFVFWGQPSAVLVIVLVLLLLLVLGLIELIAARPAAPPPPGPPAQPSMAGSS